jgi:hypothetical protein
MGALLGFHVGIWDYPTSYTAHAYVAHATVVQQVQTLLPQVAQPGNATVNLV